MKHCCSIFMRIAAAAPCATGSELKGQMRSTHWASFFCLGHLHARVAKRLRGKHPVPLTEGWWDVTSWLMSSSTAWKAPIAAHLHTASVKGTGHSSPGLLATLTHARPTHTWCCEFCNPSSQAKCGNWGGKGAHLQSSDFLQATDLCGLKISCSSRTPAPHLEVGSPKQEGASTPSPSAVFPAWNSNYALSG